MVIFFLDFSAGRFFARGGDEGGQKHKTDFFTASETYHATTYTFPNCIIKNTPNFTAKSTIFHLLGCSCSREELQHIKCINSISKSSRRKIQQNRDLRSSIHLTESSATRGLSHAQSEGLKTVSDWSRGLL